jgi:hypothetical protein
LDHLESIFINNGSSGRLVCTSQRHTLWRVGTILVHRVVFISRAAATTAVIAFTHHGPIAVHLHLYHTDRIVLAIIAGRYSSN